MQKLKKILKYSFLFYIIYAFIFAILPFSKKESVEREEKIERTDYSSREDRVALIEKREDAISVRLDLIENAEEKIDLAYYRWSDGEVSDLMLGSILEAADRGVEIRLLLDGLLHLTDQKQAMNKTFIALTSHPNIQIKLYEAVKLLSPIAWNHRMHNKMMLIDQEFALTGGRNIQDRFYLEDADKNGLVQDREVLLHNVELSSNSVLQDMENYYNELWNYEHSEEKKIKWTKQKKEKAKNKLKEIRKKNPKHKNDFFEKYFPNRKKRNWAEETLPSKKIQFVSNSLGRMKEDAKILKKMLQLSENAEDSIFIQSPYLIPSKRILKEVKNFTIDPELATLFTNSEAISPNLPAIAAYHNHREELVDSGARIVEYQGPGSTHAKSAIFDEKISVVGSFNMDPRSAYINTESMVIIEGEKFAEDLESAIAVDFDNSLELADNYRYIGNKGKTAENLSFPKKILIRILSFFAPIFGKLL